MSMCLPSKRGDSSYCWVCGKEVYASRVLGHKGFITVEFQLDERNMVGSRGDKTRPHYNLKLCSLECLSKLDVNEIRARIASFERELGVQKVELGI